eukprot:TRINITY_DN870_c2_g5_i1.p1 TRINITY_DN870_c2_g5~~TRINITY_DN870_c2_g5_i1.p1  ORF type:complete len:608 (+),score=115.42 TRINITY_DN870_c2_g5_i1:33-1856(+)
MPKTCPVLVACFIANVACFSLHPVKDIYHNDYAFAAVRLDGTVVTWGDTDAGGDSTTVKSHLVEVREIISSEKAFAAIRRNDTVVTWGDPAYGGDSSTVQSLLKDVFAITPSKTILVARRRDNSVVSWGSDNRRLSDASAVSGLTNIKAIIPQERSFAVLVADGTVYTWGDPAQGGDSSSVAVELQNVHRVFASSGTFAALRRDGTVVTWGGKMDVSTVQEKLHDIRDIFTTPHSFIATTNNGIVAWGTEPQLGSDATTVQHLINTSNIEDVYSNRYSVAVLMEDGRVVTWGGHTKPADVFTAKTVVPSDVGFSAILQNGSVVTWGVHLPAPCCLPFPEFAGRVAYLYSTRDGGLAGLLSDNSLITWGRTTAGGREYNKRSLKNVVSVNAGQDSFAVYVVRKGLVTWGAKDRSDSDSVRNLFKGNFRAYSNKRGWAAMDKNDNMVAWGVIMYSSEDQNLATFTHPPKPTPLPETQAPPTATVTLSLTASVKEVEKDAEDDDDALIDFPSSTTGRVIAIVSIVLICLSIVLLCYMLWQPGGKDDDAHPPTDSGPAKPVDTAPDEYAYYSYSEGESLPEVNTSEIQQIESEEGEESPPEETREVDEKKE